MPPVLAPAARPCVRGSPVPPAYDYPKGKAPFVRGYPAANPINAAVRALGKDPTKVGPIIDAAVQAGANNIGSITFTLSDPEQAGKIARDAAMKNAQAKADALAQAGGAKLGIVITVSDQSVTPAAPRDFPAVAAAPSSNAAAAPPTQIQPGETTVTVTVNGTYALQKRVRHVHDRRAVRPCVRAGGDTQLRPAAGRPAAWSAASSTTCFG